MSFDRKSNPREGRTGKEGMTRLAPGVAVRLAGEAGSFVSDLSPVLPSELVGGVVPQVVGREDELVWNAAAQACGTEKVHYAYAVDDGRVWYLACPSSALASSPDSWCPLVAALPGNSEFWDKQTVYIYEQEGLASALRWDPDSGRMQVFLGASRTLLPRLQSMDANFVTINTEIATPVPWRNRTLRTEQLSRAAARMLLVSGIALNLFIVAVLGVSYVVLNASEGRLESVRMATDDATNTLMTNSYMAMQSNTVKHMVRLQELLDTFATVDGTLVRYEVKPGGQQVEWESLVPPAYKGGVGNISGQVMPAMEKDGRIRMKGTQ